MLFFVRHAESEANLKGLFAGQKDDSVLTEKGREQARLTAQHIKDQNLHFDLVVSSPLKRAKETADIICQEIGFDNTGIQTDARITEYDMGSLTGTPSHAISSIELCSAVDAEDPEQFKLRVKDCLNQFSKLPGNILLVSHAGVGRIIEIIRTQGDSKLFYDLPPYGNASITKIDWL